jgi:DHA3 family macrolide efflux protein-like MFS transporter
MEAAMGVLVRYPGFRWLWLGQLLSQLGNAVFLIMGLWEIQLHSPFLLSVAGLAMMVPGAFAVIGGSFVDRHDPRRLMLWTDLLRGAAVGLGLLLLTVGHLFLIPVIIGILAVNSFGAAVFGPAETVMLPWMVTPDDLATANGTYSLTSLLAQALGSAIGGAAIVAIGIGVVFGLDMGSFWISAAAILLMMRTVAARAKTVAETTDTGAASSGPHGLWHNIREGWRGLREMPWLIRLIPQIVATNFFFTAAFTMLPYWSRHILHTGAVGFGLMEACWAAGMVAGSLGVGYVARWGLRAVVVLFSWLLGFFVLGFTLSPLAVVSGPLLFLAGLANGVLNALVFTIMQQAIPEHIRGRAFGLFMSLMTVATPTGALAAGLLLNVFPLWWSWALSACASLVLGISLLRQLPGDFIPSPAGTASVDPSP